ncbi:MAG: penicillin-binding protein 2 [Bacteroidales bacterium]|jgi:penicillin-binding protein 2|nr:penicillin-binding protein 2 [Bacteroidales bacterium]
MIDRYSDRARVIKAILIAVGAIFVIRLAVLQVFNNKYKSLAERQSLRNITIYPARGLVYDRNGELLVYNDVVYDLMVVPRSVKNIDTAYFCRSIGITREEFEAYMQKARNYSPYTASPFMKQITKEDYARWQNLLYKFDGFYVQNRTLRVYPKPIAAHVLGYVGEVDEAEMEQNPRYQMGDYVGKSGIEKTYEELLCGKKGRRVVRVDVHSREIGPYENGAHDTVPVAGEKLYSTIDAELQEYAERLMANKRGCVVALEPSTGEVLALVSAPSYNPNLLVGRTRGENYLTLLRDISKPLYNRALQGQYPPGSIFKVAQAMIALDLGVITPNSGFVCDKSLVGCHNHPSARSVQEAIKMSCNPYFYQVYRRVIQQGKYNNIYKDSQYGLTVWRNYMLKMGFGTALDIDIPNVKSGRIPDTAYYNKWYGAGKWAFSTIYSNSIGQGEVEVVPLQMANLAAIVANRGYYYIPHVVKFYGEDSTKIEKYYERHETGIDPQYFDIAAKGMYDVVHGAGGTGHRADVPGIAVCGKTGTAENYGNDHSVFISFAPMEDPKIALAVYVENAQGGGGTWAAPISGLIIEKYLKGEVQRKDVEKMYEEVNPCQKLPLTKRVKKPKKGRRR